MAYTELLILLPCHSLEDFPTHYDQEEAGSLLAAWTALWHPSLIRGCGKMPTWGRMDMPPDDLAGRLIVVPSLAYHELPTGFDRQVADAGGCLLKDLSDRQEIIEQALRQSGGSGEAIEAERVADFLALGYCYLQIELLTRQMRYSSNLDEYQFNQDVVAAAEAAATQNGEIFKEKLQACFDLLAAERDHYYAVDAFVIDLTLVSESTSGVALRDDLAKPGAKNVLLPVGVLEAMAASEPASLAAMRTAWSAATLGIAGGPIEETTTSLCSTEGVLRGLRAGMSQYEKFLGRAIQVFGRRRFGLTTTLPQLLTKLGFEGAIHASLTAGSIPEGQQLKTRWQGSDGASIDAISRVPMDAAEPGTFLRFAKTLGESMDMDHVATAVLAHWPGHATCWLEDLRRVSKYGNVLGKLVTLDKYFEETDYPSHLDRFQADEYRSPYLKEAVARQGQDPISTSVRYWRRQATAQAALNLRCVAALVRGEAKTPSGSLLAEIDATSERAGAVDLDERIATDLQSAIEDFSGVISRREAAAERGTLLINPQSFVRRLTLQPASADDLPASERPVYATSLEGELPHVVVDVPAVGYAWIRGGQAPATTKKMPALMAEDRVEQDGVMVLRNEFFEANISPITGTLQALYDYRNRGNRLSQRLALRMSEKKESQVSGQVAGGGQEYSVMAADELRIVTAETTRGEIVAEGRLLTREGQKLADFQQRYRLSRGSRVLQIDIHIEPSEELSADPWKSYYACRFAWAEEASDLWRTVNQARHKAGNNRIEAPNYVEIENGETRTTILTGGLPYHRKIGYRMLDTLLIVQGERARDFSLGVGIDVKHPMHAALDFMTPATRLEQTAPPPSSGDSAWLFHLDARNVVVTAWEPWFEDERVCGFRARVLETEGRQAQCQLSCFRPIQSARQLNFKDQLISECRVEKGQVHLELTGREWQQIEARW